MFNHVVETLKVASLSALVRYILAAIFVRTSTGASGVAILLLSRDFGADGALAGALAACLTAPHVLGPIYGKWLEKANNAFIVIAISCLLFTAFFQLAILSIERQQLWLTFLTLLLCGACSSFMMGGLSTQVNHLVGDDVTVRRKAQSWDALTYGIGLTVGPMLIAVFSSVYSAQFAVSAVMFLPVLASLIVLSLPKGHKHNQQHKHQVPNFKQVIKALWQTPALKTTLLMTSGAAFSFATLPVVAVYYSEAFQQGQENGAYLVTLYGVGCLCGALSLVLTPLKKDALTLLKNVGCLLVICLILVSLSHSFSASMLTYWICGVVNSVFFAVTIAARTEYSPARGAAQIYMWVAAAKITAASLGAFVAGLLVDHLITLPLVASITMLSLTLLICFVRIQKPTIDTT
jgi:MFS family permease